MPELPGSKFVKILGPLVVLLSSTLLSAGAFAATAYVSITGSNSNSCTKPSAPCGTIAGALTKAIAGGGFNRVVLLGSGVYPEQVTLTSSAEIIGDGAGFQGIAPPSGGTAITVNVGSGSVGIGNLQLLGSDNTAAYAINVLAAASVNITNVEIHGFKTYAVAFTPNVSGYPEMTLSSSTIDGQGCILVKPTNAAGGEALIDNSIIRNCSANAVTSNATGLKSGAWFLTVIKRSDVVGCGANAVEAMSGSTGGTTIELENSHALSCGGASVLSTGPNSNVVINGSTVSWSHTGVAVSGGGVVLSWGNNDISRSLSA